jgi:uncharacterized protein YacL
MTIWFLRCIFLVVSVGIAVFLASNLHGTGPDAAEFSKYMIMYILVALGIATLIIIVDMLSSKTDISTVSAIVFGLLIGFIMAYLFTSIITLALPDAGTKEAAEVQSYIQLALSAIFCFLGVTFILRTKDEFKFLIPYVEFKKELKGPRSQLLDTSVIIDGRISALLETGLLHSDVIIPGFVLEELHHLADSEDKIKRKRGRRGLEIVQGLKSRFDARIFERDMPGEGVDAKLIELARELEARILTTDFNLAQRARAEDIQVLNPHELSEALRPLLGIGEKLVIEIIRAGEEKNQGIGYLEDGTMVVVEGAREKVGSKLPVLVTNTHRSPAGLMVFAHVEQES